MPEPFPHEHETSVDPIARDVPCFLDRFCEFASGFRRQNFICVENEDPVVSEWEILECPVFLLWPGAVEVELHNFRSTRRGDLDRCVRAVRIDHENFVGPFHAIETAR